MSGKSAGVGIAEGRCTGPGWKRYVVAWLSCLGLMVVLAMRSEMGIAIIKMTKKQPEKVEMTARNHTYYKIELVQEVAWDHLDIGIIEASFFIGYALFSIPAGFMSSYLEPNMLLGSSVLITCLLNIAVPTAAHLEVPSAAFGVTLTIRLLQGMAEGCLYPSVHGIWRFWAPEMERSKLVTISFFGMALGPIVGLPLCGAVTTNLGWPVNFYIFGALGCAWAVAWFLIVHSRPATDPYISPEELAYIESSSVPATATGQVPCAAMVRSLPVWAIVFANVGRNWSFQFSMIGLPAYFSRVFDLNSEEVGIYLMIPFLLMAGLTPVGGTLADCVRRKFLSTTATRRLFNTVGFGVMAACLVVVGISRNLYLSTAFLTIGLGFTGIGMSGYGVNHLDIAPRFAGFLMGISNGVGTVSGVLSPIVASAVTRHGTAGEWQLVFFIAALVHVATSLFYLFCSSGELQPWAESSESAGLIEKSAPPGEQQSEPSAGAVEGGEAGESAG
ncbi:hypothetical protein BOX15_Mlig022319g1 [Macrostomum lignano]|nr:hypothetical protein BOX15_Mlig025118g2 [Macrostomum lignano]PAA76517.1 hypothetical protein BOX15_Mlig022319g1 [Macrostomum lignano]